jgi:hypothetical protein
MEQVKKHYHIGDFVRHPAYTNVMMVERGAVNGFILCRHGEHLMELPARELQPPSAQEIAAWRAWLSYLTRTPVTESFIAQQLEPQPYALTEDHVASLERAIRAEGYNIRVDTETGEVKLYRVKGEA